MNLYELWLDESGTFFQKDQKDPLLNPSLIGGVLVEQGTFLDQELRNLAGEPGHKGFAHATDYSNSQAVGVQLLALKYLRQKGAHLVYFENRKRVGDLNNRELYLRLMARGLVRLMRKIGQDGEFRLDIYIARRIDKERNDSEITAEEYRAKLRDYILEDRRRGLLDFEEVSEVIFSILSARKESRLMLADFASNARLTRDSGKFGKHRNELISLFEDDYIFSFSRIETSMSRINAMISSGDLAGALMELYTGCGEMDHKSVFSQIMRRFNKLSYRLKRLNLNSFVSSMVAYVRQETEFERSEAVVRLIINEFFSELKNKNVQVQTDESLFRLHAWLLDMYLREGDILSSERELKEMGLIVEQMGYRMENLAYLYLYNDRKALYEINCMDYQTAVDTINKTIGTMEKLITWFRKDPFISSVYGDADMSSEYLGNALCMKVYAEMFLQREDRRLYSRCLKKDTEAALSQYRYEGELERNQQYRAHVEMEQGHYEDALTWLLKTRQIEYDPDDRRDCCRRYLKDAGNEDRLSRHYYVMYYLELMYESKRAGSEDLAHDMYEALKRARGIYGEFFSNADTGIRSDYLKSVDVNEDVLQDILGLEVRSYHPVEIIYWKYGMFLFENHNSAEAIKWLDRAIDLCGEQKEYLRMQVIGLAIQLDKLWCILGIQSSRKRNRRAYLSTRDDIRMNTEKLMTLTDIPPKILEFIESVRNMERNIPDSWEEAVKSRKEIAVLARRIAY